MPCSATPWTCRITTARSRTTCASTACCRRRRWAAPAAAATDTRRTVRNETETSPSLRSGGRPPPLHEQPERQRDSAQRQRYQQRGRAERRREDVGRRAQKEAGAT